MRKSVLLSTIALALAGCGGGSPVSGGQARLTTSVAWTASFGSSNSATSITFPAAGASATVHLVEGCTGPGIINCPFMPEDPGFLFSAPSSCTAFTISTTAPHSIDPPGSYIVTAVAPGSCTLTATPLDSRFPPTTLTVNLASP